MKKSDIKDKIRALLNQAADRAGTPEGDAFQARAFDLIAKYGLSENDIRRGYEPGEIITETYQLHGPYMPEKRILLREISGPLGVYMVYYQGTDRALLTGTERNIERAIFLYELIEIQAMREAAGQYGDAYTATRTVRRSFLQGYAARIGGRLHRAENDAREDMAAHGALVPLDEYDRAMNHAHANMRIGSARRSRSGFSADGFSRGGDAADRADIGNTRVAGARQLTA